MIGASFEDAERIWNAFGRKNNSRDPGEFQGNAETEMNSQAPHQA
jgi:hypothetical protein